MIDFKKIKETLLKKDFFIERDNLNLANGKRVRKNYREKYFEGYVNDVRFDANGNAVKQKVYIGDYYKPQITKEQQIAYRIFVSVGFIACVVAFIVVATRQIDCNSEWFCVLPQVLTIVSLFFWGRGIVVWFFVGEKYTIAEYRRGVVNTRIGTFFTGCCLFITAIIMIVDLCVLKQMYNIWLGILLLVSSFIAFGTYYKGKKITYERIDNPDTPHVNK